MIVKTSVISLALVAAAPALATTSISGSVDTGVRSSIGSVSLSDSDNQALVAPSTGTMGSVASIADLMDSGARVNSYASVDAAWLSSDSGTVEIDWGWDIARGSFGGSLAAETNQVSSNWRYTFTATANGTFEGDYNVVGSGDQFGLQPIYTSGDFGGLVFGGNVSNPSGSGTFSIALNSGQTYTFSMFNFGNISGGGDRIANANAVINWRITGAAVPEPASWAIMIVGFGLAGTALRRRTTVTFA